MAGEVMTANVCELVEKNCKATILRPVVAIRGKDDCRSDQAARERHLRVFTSEKARGLIDRETIGHFI
jgi:hypothetical protein